jgi:hypothetical protein
MYFAFFSHSIHSPPLLIANNGLQLLSDRKTTRKITLERFRSHYILISVRSKAKPNAELEFQRIIHGPRNNNIGEEHGNTKPCLPTQSYFKAASLTGFKIIETRDSNLNA